MTPPSSEPVDFRSFVSSNHHIARPVMPFVVENPFKGDDSEFAKQFEVFVETHISEIHGLLTGHRLDFSQQPPCLVNPTQLIVVKARELYGRAIERLMSNWMRAYIRGRKCQLLFIEPDATYRNTVGAWLAELHPTNSGHAEVGRLNVNTKPIDLTVELAGTFSYNDADAVSKATLKLREYNKMHPPMQSSN